MIGKLEASVYAASSGVLGLVAALYFSPPMKTIFVFMAAAWFITTIVIYFGNGQIISSARKWIASVGFSLGFAGIMISLSMWVVS